MTKNISNYQANKRLREEDKAIQEALVTPYEKVMKILRKVQNYLGTSEMAKEVEWVIQIIHSQNLYSYQGLTNTSFNPNKKNSFEMKSFLGFLDAYSEGNSKFTKHLISKRSHTTMHKVEYIHHLKTKFTKEDILEVESSKVEIKDSLVFDEYSEESINEINSSLDHKMNNANEGYSFKEKACPVLSNNEMAKLENSLLSFHFNPFDFYQEYTKENAFFKGAYCLFNKFNIQSYSSDSKMQNFIKEIKQNYSTIPYYHTEMHGLDVCQTVSMYILQTNLKKNLQISNIDVVSLVIAGLVHDVGHPGYNNDYQVKMQTALAVNYNDKNVLENYHTALTFQIIKNDSNNIFSQLPNEDFQYMRKRIIEMILSTDMLFHSRIYVLMKNRLELNQISNGENCDKLISPNSENLFDAQQEVLNFMIHTADISHTSKDFNISYQWTMLLTQEFWRQGDDEKKHGFQVSFIFDRANAEIHRSQIGFIKAIILPIFDLFDRFLPELKIYNDNVQTNLNEWSRLCSEKKTVI